MKKKNTKINFKIPLKEKIVIAIVIVVAIILSVIAIKSPEFNSGYGSVTPNDTSYEYEHNNDESYDDSFSYESNSEEENLSDFYVPDGDN